MSDYSNYKLGKVDLETKNAYLAIIENFTSLFKKRDALIKFLLNCEGF